MTLAASQDRAPTQLIAGEIKALRKGRGVRARDLDERLGQQLRELVGGATEGDISVLRRALTMELSTYAARLPDDLHTAVMASLGLSSQTRHIPNFGDRVSWLAEQSGHTSRTALRRIATAEQLLAEEVARELVRRRGRPASAPDGWYLDEFQVLLRLDTPTPESHEHRRIVATQADLTEVMAWLDVPRLPDQQRMGLEAEVVYGGRLLRREEPSRSRFQFFVQLPTPLQPGEAHEYELILRVPEGDQLKPHCIFTPECQCNIYDLRIRFDLEHLPAWIRRVDGETVRMFEDAHPGDEPVIPNAAGEVHERFESPEMYLGYGFQWQP